MNLQVTVQTFLMLWKAALLLNVRINMHTCIDLFEYMYHVITQLIARLTHNSTQLLFLRCFQALNCFQQKILRWWQAGPCRIHMNSGVTVLVAEFKRSFPSRESEGLFGVLPFRSMSPFSFTNLRHLPSWHVVWFVFIFVKLMNPWTLKRAPNDYYRYMI